MTITRRKDQDILDRVMAGERDVDILRGGIVTVSQLAYAKRAARKRGVVLPPSRIKRERMLKIGSLQSAIWTLTNTETKWLLRNLPSGSTVAEFCVALIRDAVDESPLS